MRTHGTPSKATITNKTRTGWIIFLQLARWAALPARCSILYLFSIHTYFHKVLTYVEYRAVSDVFQNIDPPLPSPPSECVLPPVRGVGG
jgi:hypothetical protein